MENDAQPLTNLDVLIAKLGHELEEIRIRSLNNILLKLEHGIITEMDLVQNKMLFKHLLGWFNFSSDSKRTAVLKLLLQLSKHSSATQLLISIGAVDFLHALRNDLSCVQQPIVDKVLEQLFLLRVPDSDNETAKCCENVNVMVNIQQVELHSQSGTVEVVSDALAQSDDNNPVTEKCMQKFLEPTVISKNESLVDATNFTYFESTSPAHNERYLSIGNINYIVFPWLSLTSTDKHVLSSTDGSLKSGDPATVINSCNFLNDVVLQDFPAEIFLQRPQILKTLFNLLCQSSKNMKLMLKILECLHTLSVKLLSRMTFQSDPAMLNSRTDLRISTSSRPSIQDQYSGSGSPTSSDSRSFPLGQVDALPQDDVLNQRIKDTPTENHISSTENIPSDSEQDLEEDNLDIHLLQMSLQEYCVCILNEILPLFYCNNYQVVSYGVILIHNSVDLLKKTLEICCKDFHILSVKMTAMLSEFFVNVGKMLQLHLQKYNSNVSEISMRFHRLAFLNLLICFHRIYKILLSSQVQPIKLPEELMQIIQKVIYDYTFMFCYPELHRDFLELVKCSNEDIYSCYVNTAEVCQAMDSACRFMLRANDIEKDSLMTDAELALPSLPYHRTINFIQTFFVHFSYICSQPDLSTDLYQKGLGIASKLLIHSTQVIRLAAYRSCITHLKGVFEIEQTSDVISITNVKYLFEDNILKNICIQGLHEKNDQITEAARELLTILFQNQLKMQKEWWEKLLLNLRPHFPILQGFADLNNSFGYSVISVIDPSISSLNSIEIVRGNLRLMLSVNKKLQSTAYFNLIEIFFKQNDPLEPLFSSDVVKESSDLFISDAVSDLLNCGFNTAVYQVENLLSVLEILKSSDMEIDIKKSAVQQLSFILESLSMHDRFIKEKGILVLQNILEDIFKMPDLLNLSLHLREMLSACFHILAVLLTHNTFLRNELVQHHTVYRNILIGALLLQEFPKSKCELIQILILLVFNEHVQIIEKHPPAEGGEYKSYYMISLPGAIIHRYHIPFHSEIQDNTETLQDAVKESGLPDPLLSPPAVNMLRVAWNMHWFGGVEEFLDSKEIRIYSEFHSSLQLREIDQCIFKTTYSPFAISECLRKISKASTHKDVYQTLHILKLQLLARINHKEKIFSEIALWKDAFERFLFLPPKSRADENLFCVILDLLMFIIHKNKSIGADEIIDWLSSLILNTNNAIINLVVNQRIFSEKQMDKGNSKALGVLLIKFIATMFKINTVYEELNVVLGSLIKSLFQNLMLSDTHHFYNLSVLESTLKCLMHITARSRWSEFQGQVEQEALLKSLFVTLVDVISAFHAGAGGIDNSFMGNGVTKTSTIILQHLIMEMKQKPYGYNLIRSCVEDPISDTTRQLGLMWLIPLLTHRDPEVRASGLGICVGLSKNLEGCLLLSKHLKELLGGVWGIAISFLLDHSEASFVREWAAYLLSELISLPMSESSEDGVWRGPEMYNTESQSVIFGKEALLYLLDHNTFFKEIAIMLSHYFPHKFVPISCVERNFKTLNLTSASVSEGTQDCYFVKPEVEENLELSYDNNDDGALMTTNTSLAASRNQGAAAVPHVIIVTPSLIGTISCVVCQIMEMLPEYSVTIIREQEIIDSFLRCLESSQNLHSVPFPSEIEQKFFKDLLEMHSSVLKFITTCMLSDDYFIERIACSSQNLKTIINLLDSRVLEKYSNRPEVIYALWNEVYKILSISLNCPKVDAHVCILPLIALFWELITDNLQIAFRELASNDLLLDSLRFFSLIFSCEAKKFLHNSYTNQRGETSFRMRLENLDKGSDDGGKKPKGAVFGELLLELYKKTITVSQAKSPSYLMLVNALRILLLVSYTAKSAVLEGGLVLHVLNHIREIHVCYTIKSFASPSMNKKKDLQTYQDFMAQLQLLNSFMYNQIKCKIAACDAGLSEVLYQIWPWCLQDASLTTLTLELMCTFTADSEQSARSLALTNCTGSSKSVGSGTLLHSLIRIFQCEVDRYNGKRESTHLLIVLELFSNLCLANESRGVLCKSNVVDEFCKLPGPKSNNSKNNNLSLEKGWFRFLENISFYQDGQDAVFRTKGGIELVLEYAESSSPIKSSAVVVLRNLCLNSTHQTRLVNSGKVIPLLVMTINNESSLNLKTVASVALWALCANCQKAKAILKNEKIWFYLVENKLRYQNGNGESVNLSKTLEMIIDICSSNS